MLLVRMPEDNPARRFFVVSLVAGIATLPPPLSLFPSPKFNVTLVEGKSGRYVATNGKCILAAVANANCVGYILVG